MLFRSIATITLLAATARAAPTLPLRTAVDHVLLAPTLRVVPVSAGATVEQRYHAPSPGFSEPNVPLVLIIPGTPSEPADLVEVTRAERHGNRIEVALQVRHFTGTFACTMCVGPIQSFATVELGGLPRGDYLVVVDRTTLTYTDEQHPERAANGHTAHEQRSFLVTPPAPPRPAHEP